jgi:hypothetical protein
LKRYVTHESTIFFFHPLSLLFLSAARLQVHTTFKLIKLSCLATTKSNQADYKSFKLKP